MSYGMNQYNAYPMMTGMPMPQQAPQPMMTGNPYLDRLMSMQAPAPQPQPVPQQVQPCQVASVSGKSGADAFWLPANSSILLLDADQPIVWLKQTDAAGRPTSTPYRISPMDEQPGQPDYSALSERVSRLEERLNGKPDDEPVKPAKRPGTRAQGSAE